MNKKKDLEKTELHQFADGINIIFINNRLVYFRKTGDEK